MNGSEVKAAIDSFVNRVDGLKHLGVHSYTVGAVRQGKGNIDQKWGSHPGVYVFIQANEVVYVGRAAKDTLRQRVFEQALADGDPRWDTVIHDANASLLVIPFASDDWYWVASLEVRLIELAQPHFNRRSA